MRLNRLGPRWRAIYINSYHFYCHVYLSVYFKSTWYLAEMLWSGTLRDTQWPNTLTDSDSTTGTQRHRWDRVSQNFLCFIATLRSSPQDRIYTLLGTIVSRAREPEGLCLCQLFLEISTLSPHFLIIPQQSSLKGDDAFRAGAPLLHSLAAE